MAKVIVGTYEGFIGFNEYRVTVKSVRLALAELVAYAGAAMNETAANAASAIFF